MSKSAYKHNHVISQCLLERFQDDSCNIVRHDTKRGSNKLTKSGLEGFIKGLWTNSSKGLMESLWNKQAETDIKLLFGKIDNQEKLNKKDINLLARFCAIHFVRSKEFIKLYELIRQKNAEIESIKFNDYGFAGKYIVRLKFLKQTKIPCQFFEEQMKCWYDKTVKELSRHGVEIRVATGHGRIILPDGGLLISDVDANKYQPTGGIALLQARQAVLPISPIHLLGFNTKIKGVKYINMNDTNVSNANSKLVKACHEFYYCTPNCTINFT